MTQDTRQFIETHADADVKLLALQASRYPQVDMKEAIQQIWGRRIARTKLPRWWRQTDMLYPSHLPLEQCSSEATASYKARLIPETLENGSLLDMSGGFGVDFCLLAERFGQITYVEQRQELCVLANHNFPLLGCGRAAIHCGDSVDFLQHAGRFDCLFIDPARRDKTGGKTVAIKDCEPDISRLAPLLLEKASFVMVKLSPMLDIKSALLQLPHVREVHVVAVAGECKELLLLMEAGADSRCARFCCVDLPADYAGEEPAVFRFTESEEGTCNCAYASVPELYLYEPHAALLKAGAFRSVAERFEVKKLHPNSHLYTSEQLVGDFPGRSFRIVTWGHFSKYEVKELQRQISKANVTVRNFPATVVELRRRLKLAEGGDDYLFATTLADGKKIWIQAKRVK